MFIYFLRSDPCTSEEELVDEDEEDDLPDEINTGGTSSKLAYIIRQSCTFETHLVATKTLYY